jgi:hypothetical protein
VASAAEARLGGMAEEVPTPTYEADPMMRRETLELVRAYYKIADPQVRRHLFDLTKAIANATERR